jgi:hypothetical protein
MLCRHCNTENPETARFCINCGKSLAPAGTQPVTPRQDATRGAATAPPPRPATKVAAICVWIVSAILLLISFVAFAPSAAEVQACVRAGGSGSTCPGPHFPAQLFWVAAILGAGYGYRLWSRK